MAIRNPSSTLRRRLAWTLCTAGLIGLVSVVSIVVFRAPSRDVAKATPAAHEAGVVDTTATEKQAADSTEQPRLAVDGNSTPPAVHPTIDGNVLPASAVLPGNSTTGPKPAGDFHSPRYGYSVSLAGTPWARWENLAEVVPEAEWGALLHDYGRLLIIPMALADLDPRPEALDHALLARLGISYPSQQLTDFKTLEHGGAVGHSFRLSREVNGAPNIYRLWILRHGNFAYLAAAWLDTSVGKAASIDPTPRELDDALAAISFDVPPPALIDPGSFNRSERQTHGTIYNNLGLFAFNSHDYAEAKSCFRRAFEIEPTDASILLNLANADIELKQYGEAIAELEPCLPRFSNQPDLWACRAYLLSELGKTDAALAAYAALFASGYQAEGPFTQYVNLLLANDRVDEALAAVESFSTHHESFALRRMQASLYRRIGKPEQAIAVLTQLAATGPFSAEVAYDLAEDLWAIDRFQDSLEVCRELFEHRYDTAHTYLLQARNEFALKWYAAARLSLQGALKREPANKDATELLALVNATLGEGNTAGIRDEIAPVPWPVSLSASGTSAPKVADEAEFREFGAYYRSRRVAIEFQPAKSFKLTDRRVIRVLDPSGLVRFSTIQIPFDPGGEQIYVNSLRVLDADGKEVAAAKPTDFYVIDRPTDAAANQAKLLNIPVPGLQIGRTIELTVTRRRLVPPADFPYTTHVFSSDVPVVSSEVCVQCDTAAIRYQTAPNLKLTKFSGGLTWSIARPLVYRDEPLQEPRLEFLPHVTVVSAAASWQQLAGDYLKSIADRLEPDESIAKLAQQITADAKSNDDRTTALIRYVQEHLTYKAIEFGSRSRIPNQPAAIVANKYGDCKDHALLLVQLMRSCGMATQLVLANLDEPVDPRCPGFEQFNHVLVYAPDFHGGRFIDCTDKNSDLATTQIPLDLGGAKVLVLDPADARLMDIPVYADHSSRMEVLRTVRLSDQTDAAVDETVTVMGYQAAMLRGTFKDVPPADRPATLQGEIAPPGSALQVQTLVIENLDQTDKPLVFKAKCLVRNCFRATPSGKSNGDAAAEMQNGTLLGQLPLLWERVYLDVPSVPNRRTPFAIEYPLDFSSTIEFITPKGYTLEPLPATEGHGDSSFVTWKLRAEPTEHGVQLHYQLHEPAAKYFASQYADYDNALDRAVTAISQSLVLKRAK
jgi:tetratricopeptide (TPR) repeat protein